MDNNESSTNQRQDSIQRCPNMLSSTVTHQEQLAYIRSQSIEESQDGNLRQEPRVRADAGFAYWFAPDGLLSLIFYNTPRPSTLGQLRPLVIWNLPHQTLMRKCPTDLPTGQSEGGNFSVPLARYIKFGGQVNENQPAWAWILQCSGMSSIWDSNGRAQRDWPWWRSVEETALGGGIWLQELIRRVGGLDGRAREIRRI